MNLFALMGPWAFLYKFARPDGALLHQPTCTESHKAKDPPANSEANPTSCKCDLTCSVIAAWRGSHACGLLWWLQLCESVELEFPMYHCNSAESVCACDPLGKRAAATRPAGGLGQAHCVCSGCATEDVRSCADGVVTVAHGPQN